MNRSSSWTSNPILIQLISWHLHIPAHHICGSTHFSKDLNLDNMDINLLVAMLEKSYGIYLTEAQVKQVEVVDDLARMFERSAAA